MNASFVTFTNTIENPLMAYSSLKSYLKYKNIEIDLKVNTIFCKRREKDHPYHSNITDYTTEYIFGKTVDDIVDLESIVKLFRNYDLNEELLKDIPIPSFRNELIDRLNANAINLSKRNVVFFSVFRYHFLYHLYLAAAIKKINKNTKIIFGGPQIINSKLTVELLDKSPFIDNIISGDVETGVYDYLTKKIDRIYYPVPLKLKELQMPDYSGFPLKIFNNQIMMCTSRDCFNKCSYCPSGSYPFRKTPMEKIDEWITYYGKKRDVKSIYFTDAMFNSSSKRFHEILDILIKKGNGLSFYIWCHGEDIDESHIKKLSKLNFVHPGKIVMAYDTASKELSTKINRPMADNIDELIKIFIENGINLYTPFIGGLPIETVRDYQLTYNKIKQLRELYQEKVAIAIHSFLYIPGSPFYDNYKDYGITLEYWDNETSNIYPAAKDVVLKIPRYYYGGITVDTFNERIKTFVKFRD